MTHLATRLGLEDDPAFVAAYWRVFEAFFGQQNAQMVKATLLARVGEADMGARELDRVCYGLRQTMGWAAEAIEKKALQEIGQTAPLEPAQPSENRATT